MRRTWSRRAFLQTAAAGTLHSMVPGARATLAQTLLPPPRSQRDAPELTSGRVVPLLESNVARPLRYTPDSGGFAIRNGQQFFNRPLYGPNIPFRVDAGDHPEFSLYLPGHGGNLRLGVAFGGRSRWLHACENVRALSRDGAMFYEISDPLLPAGARLRVQAVTRGAGLWLQMECSGTAAAGVELLWAFGGVSGRKGRRNGDIGCEVEPVSQFFQLRPEECRNNRWTISAAEQAQVSAPRATLDTAWPAGATLRLGDAAAWDSGWDTLWASATAAPQLPVLMGRAACMPGVPCHIAVEQVLPQAAAATAEPDLRTTPPSAAEFDSRCRDVANVARRVRWQTPDAFLDSVAGALCTAADALWDEAQGCLMHGAVAWRMPLAGWRGDYVLDVLGEHDRMRRQVRHWVARQNVDAVVNGSGGTAGPEGFYGMAPARGTPDAGTHGSRTEHLLHSNGDLSHNHYDMNLVFFDAVLRHLRWTGDLDLAREVWPAMERHAAWERRLFRREYGSATQTAPLYEAYAAIWASDNLQYNGGGAAHSSAYNVFLNRGLAEQALALGKPDQAAAYHAEAEAIVRAMHQLLWLPQRGAFAESRDWLGSRQAGLQPALWTVYHTIDSEVVSPRQAWQMVADRLRALRKIPVCGPDVPADAGWQLACSNWQPYVWSLTLLVTAEMLHMALAMFQAGMAADAFDLLRGTLLDAGFRGLCPGNFPMSLQLDPHRQESQRDFGDPVGCAARALVEGLWGVLPDRMNGKLRLRPQLPLAWATAHLEHPELTLAYSRQGLHERWQIASRFQSSLLLELELRGRTVELPRVSVNGQPVHAAFVPDAVGEPRLLLRVPVAAAAWTIDVEWHGDAPAHAGPEAIACRAGERVRWPHHMQAHVVDDPQACLHEGVAKVPGGHTVFLRQQHALCDFWLPVELQITEAHVNAEPDSAGPREFAPVALEASFTGQLRDIFTRLGTQPRSGFCSLNLPDTLLGGWANFDSTAVVNDAGLRNAGGAIELGSGLRFLTPSGSAPNCVYLSQWACDAASLRLPLQGHARALHLLLVGTTFPQATGSAHATITLRYADGSPSHTHELRSPNDWWPVEQDYLIDDFVFRLSPQREPGVVVTSRVDLATAQCRPLPTEPGDGGAIRGGAAFAVRMDADPRRPLQAVEFSVPLYGVVLGLLAVTLER